MRILQVDETPANCTLQTNQIQANSSKEFKTVNMTRKPSPTLADVARLANVSTATISRALNTPSSVAEKTRDRITAAIEVLGYTSNFAGRVLASNRSNTVGAVIPTLANAMFANGIHSFQEELSDAGVTMLLASSSYDPEREFDQIRSLIAHGADGLMLIGTSRPQKTKDFLRLRSVPYVLSWCFEHDKSQIYAGFDNYAASFAIAQKVLEYGHRDVAMIAGVSTGNDRARKRIEGVKAAIAAHGRNTRMVGLVEAPYLLNDAKDAFDAVYDGPTQPSVIICGSDVLAAGAITRAIERDLRVPQDISITGFDDIGLASVVSPGITTVHVPQLEMGRSAAKLLLGQISKNAQLDSIEIETKIILRGSLAPVNA